MRHFDVVIVGAGVAGLVAAIDMARAGLKVAVLEAKEFRELQPPDHVRVSALNIVSERILAHLDVWESIPQKWRAPFREIQVRDAEGSHEVTFSYRDIGCAHLGHIVANQALIKALLDRAKQLSSFSLICPAQLDALLIAEDQVKLKLTGGETYSATLVIGADGAQSWVRKTLNIPLNESAYQHTAVVTTVQTKRPHQSIARQRFLKEGPIAFLPLQDAHQCSIVCSTSAENAESLIKMDRQTLEKKIAQTIDQELGEVTVMDKPLSFPLIMRHATHYVHPRVALVGDAAHTLHPLAGQGMNLGVLDAACLSEVVINNFKAQRDIGLVQNLRRYERWRRGDNQLMIDAMSFFKEGFAVQRGFLRQLRDLSLSLTNTNRWLRKFFIQKAMGFRGELPQIGR